MSMTFESLRAFLVDELAVENDQIGPETMLFSTGLVDSFSLVSLLTHIENEAGVQIPPSDINLNNFDNITSMLSYLGMIKHRA
jgi:acyl carrier protein